MSTIRFKREISSRIADLAHQFPALILTGARQTGKTTLLRELFPHHSYVTLDLPSAAELAENDPQAFLANYPPPVLIDEAQYAPMLFRHLKIAIDQNRDHAGQFILTGSQKFNLMKEVSDSLAGRCVWLELEGLSLPELRQTGMEPNALDVLARILTRGTQPELWARPQISATDYYRSYLATYLERDVRQILNISSLRDFERFIRVCAARNGQLINKSEIAKDVGVSAHTVNQWLSVLEASNQIALLEPYFINTTKRIVKTPKLYFCEVGLLSFLLGLDQSNISQSPFVGAMWESYCFAELRKVEKNHGLNSKLWFYRDNRAREVDFLVEHHNHLDFVETKWTARPDIAAAKAMEAVAADLFPAKSRYLIQPGRRYVVCRSEVAYPLGPATTALSLSQLISGLDRGK